MTNREKMMELLESEFGIGFMRTTEEFNGSQGGIWLSAENGETSSKDGREFFDYYHGESGPYELGVHSHIDNWAGDHGWWFEWNDPGTIMLWPN